MTDDQTLTSIQRGKLDEGRDNCGVRTGRYAEWKYLITDDCVLKAKNEAKKWSQS
jgi:hypothetical protein